MHVASILLPIKRRLRRGAQSLVKRVGYRLVPDVPHHPDGYVLYPYRDHEEYLRLQNKANALKAGHRVWASEDNIAFLAGFLRETVGLETAGFGLCHGTRTGEEQAWFRRHLGEDWRVLGTELAADAARFPDTLAPWDFHEVKPEWVDACDFVYSNSLDHSYDPRRCLDTWLSCVRPGRGVCVLEHSTAHGEDAAGRYDPFGVGLDPLLRLCLEWGGGRWAPRWLLDAPDKGGLRWRRFVILWRFPVDQTRNAAEQRDLDRFSPVQLGPEDHHRAASAPRQQTRV